MSMNDDICHPEVSRGTSQQVRGADTPPPALLPPGVLLPALTQFLPGWPCPRGPWYRAVCRGGAQPATAGEGGGGGPEELGVFVGLGAVVLAARLHVGGCWCRHGCTRQGGQRGRQRGARRVLVVLLPQEQPWKHTERSHIQLSQRYCPILTPELQPPFAHPSQPYPGAGSHTFTLPLHTASNA